jgi:hypothetical protein
MHGFDSRWRYKEKLHLPDFFKRRRCNVARPWHGLFNIRQRLGAAASLSVTLSLSKGGGSDWLRKCIRHRVFLNVCVRDEAALPLPVRIRS